MKRFCHNWRILALITVLVLLFTGTAMAAKRYETLEFGDRGSDVLKLQQCLLALGYDPQGVDGKFGRGTENAVKMYQAANGLEADGKAGHLTLSKLFDGESIPAGGASGSGSSGSTGSSSGENAPGTATSTNPNTLKYGDSGSRVTELQTALTKLGYNTNGIDGKFGRGTHEAVVKFQKDNGLYPDGLAGSKTLELIDKRLSELNNSGSSSSGSSTGNSNSSSSSGNSSSTSGSTASGVPSNLTRTLRKGCTGDDVLTVQKKLKELGYYTSILDGVYGNGSIAAVRAFQQNNGLTADGLAGTRTFKVMFSGSAVPAGSASGSGSTSGSSGSTSGSSTSGSSSGETGSSSETYTTLRYGDKGESVRKLQKALKELNYSVSADGDYGALTQMAVSAFQKCNGLEADGVAGPETQQLLYSGKAKPYDASVAGNTSTLPEGAGSATGPSTSKVKLLHWFNEIKPNVKSGQTVTVFDPATNLQWTLRFMSLGRHADSEPLTALDTQIMFKAFGYKNTWTPKPVYVKLPSGTWTLATMHNVPHLSGSIKDNEFDGHLCVHFLRDMDECQKNDPDYGVQNQNAIRKKWKEMTGQTVE